MRYRVLGKKEAMVTATRAVNPRSWWQSQLSVRKSWPPVKDTWEVLPLSLTPLCANHSRLVHAGGGGFTV